MFYSQTHRGDFYLGDTQHAPGHWAHVFADVRISHTQPRIDQPEVTAETVDHRHITDYNTVSVTFEVIARRRGFNPVTMSPSMAPDSAWLEVGQVPADARRIHDGSMSPVSVEHRQLIESAWEQHHLNNLVAGCDHMAELTVPDGVADPTGYKLQNWVCPVTGYRYGSTWLVREIPADQIEQLKSILTATTQH
jgi:hypothetical protein